MRVEYRKDLHHSYMILTEEEGIKSEGYCMRMLEHQSIEGLLSMELRRLDGSRLLFYDITAKQVLSMLLEKNLMTFEVLKSLMSGILKAVETAYEYLLIEDDFVLLPNFIYLDIAKNKPFLCYYSGHRKNIFEQLSSLLEYLMNKVDYKDKDAVMLVYRLYAITREEGYTFNQLLEVLESRVEGISNIKKSRRRVMEETPEGTREGMPEEMPDATMEAMAEVIAVQKEAREKPRKFESNIPIMIEKLEDEVEKSFYPISTFLYTGISVLVSVFLLVLSYTSGIIYNTYGERIDYSKLFALLLIIFCAEGYIMKKLWDKKNKITKMIPRHQYVDPRNDFALIPQQSHKQNNKYSMLQWFTKRYGMNMRQTDFRKVSGQDQVIRDEQVNNINQRNSRKHVINGSPVINKPLWDLNVKGAPNPDIGKTISEGIDNPTCILNEAIEQTVLTLKPLDGESYQPIIMKEFPFFIGKLKKNVDYCLEKDVVSRYHAKITKEQEHFFITDLNSMNGTFVNQESVLTYERKKIKSGDIIALANINYQLTIQTVK